MTHPAADGLRTGYDVAILGATRARQVLRDPRALRRRGAQLRERSVAR
ncbi:hypothetical protein [Streptomyces sp. CBMA156]|nr:hypothetical protein [Streptomyces sp. CBMA156]